MADEPPRGDQPPLERRRISLDRQALRQPVAEVAEEAVVRVLNLGVPGSAPVTVDPPPDQGAIRSNSKVDSVTTAEQLNVTQRRRRTE